jgi:hypothetical protein
MKPLVLEADKKIGGSTAMSGGGIWAPNNRFIRKAGTADSMEAALRYLDAVVGNVGRASSGARKRAYLESINEAIDFLKVMTSISAPRRAIRIITPMSRAARREAAALNRSYSIRTR